MRAIEQALSSFKFSGKSLKWYTDNQNCLRIVQAGSIKEPLQSLAYSIFSICTQHSISIDIQWIQLFSPDQFCVSASTASEHGFQNKELNLLIFLLETTRPIEL
jgi:hypothetical protein